MDLLEKRSASQTTDIFLRPSRVDLPTHDCSGFSLTLTLHYIITWALSNHRSDHTHLWSWAFILISDRQTHKLTNTQGCFYGSNHYSTCLKNLVLAWRWRTDAQPRKVKKRFQPMLSWLLTIQFLSYTVRLGRLIQALCKRTWNLYS